MMTEYYVTMKYDLNVDRTIKFFIKAYSKEQLVDQLGDDYYITDIKKGEEMKVNTA